ncbi:SBBP repeat-containing protein [Planctomycetota bacterium]
MAEKKTTDMQKWLCVLILTSWLVIPSALAEEPKKGIDPQAVEIVKKMCQAYKDLKSYEGTCSMKMIKTRNGGEIANHKVSTAIIFVHPNKVFLDHTMVKYISDGKILWVVPTRKKQCIKRNAPAKITYRDIAMAGAVNPALNSMFSEDLYTSFMTETKSLKLGASEKIGDKEMLVLEKEGRPDHSNDISVKVTSKIWIGKEDYLLYRETGEIFGTIPVKQSETDERMVFEMTYTHNKINEEIPDSVFTFESPQDRKLIDNYKEDNTETSKSWTRQLGSPNNDCTFGVAIDSSGNIYVAGATDGGLDGNPSAGKYDIFVVKYDSAGIKQWTRQLGTSKDDYATDVVTDSSGNIYITGWTDGDFDGNTSAGGQDILLVKYDSAGIKQWVKQLGTSKNDQAFRMAIDISDNIYVVGRTSGKLDGNISAGFSDFLVVKYDSDGIKQWTRQTGTNNLDKARGVAVDSSGNIYVVGSVQNGWDTLVIKYNSAGTKQWDQQSKASVFDEAINVITDDSDNIYVVGWAGGGLDGNIFAGGFSDVFVVKYNPAGTK